MPSDILADIFYGRNIPLEHNSNPSREFLECNRKFEELRAQLADRLDSGGNDLLNQLTQHQMDMEIMSNYNAFERGFSIGVQLMIKALGGGQGS